MKTLIAILTVLLFTVSGWAMEMPADKKAPEVKGKCPKTQVVGDVSDCLKCHVEGNFAVKETKRNADRKMPYGMDVLSDGNGEYGYMLLMDIKADPVKEFLDYLEHHKIKRAVIEIYSPGGSLFGAWRIIGLMNMAKTGGMIIETRCNGFAASAGFLIFISGSMGHRTINPYCAMMWHELISFKMLSIDTPSSSEDEAKILRQLQNTGNAYIATRSNLSKEELDEKVKRKEFWMNGKEAFDFGFADKLLKPDIK